MVATQYITQYGSTAYLGMTRVVSGQFQHFENTWRGITAKRSRKEQKEHYSSTKVKAGLHIYTHHVRLERAQETRTKFSGFEFSSSFFIFISFSSQKTSKFKIKIWRCRDGNKSLVTRFIYTQ